MGGDCRRSSEVARTSALRAASAAECARAMRAYSVPDDKAVDQRSNRKRLTHTPRAPACHSLRYTSTIISTNSDQPSKLPQLASKTLNSTRNLKAPEEN
ncbi:unnamed protein product [Leptosia nina]|uniref:Uncharacterized protein n=1 Tax=Leptosia nina TaxID=320188 RepID=A0AAV1JP00_9NEOP